jgi:hypothetical protein
MNYWIFVCLAAISLQAAEPLTTSLPQAIFPIDHTRRTSDIVQAYDLLRKDKPTLKIALRTSSGAIYANVTELSAASGGTLLFVKNLSQQGSKYTILPVEEVAEINYSN